MGRRRRKQEKAERDLAASPDQGELLAGDPSWIAPPAEVAPKPLVVFEMVEEGGLVEKEVEPVSVAPPTPAARPMAEREPEPEPADVASFEPDAAEEQEPLAATAPPAPDLTVHAPRVPVAPDPDPEPAPPAGPRAATDARFRLARELYAAGRVNEAMAVFREVAEREPQSLKARHNLGVLYDETGHHDLAVEQFEAARLLEPDNVDVLVNLGSAIGSLGRFDEAEGVLRRAQKLSPDAVAVRAALGVLSFRRGLYHQADHELKWVCEHAPDHGPAHFYRGEALNRLGRVDQALEVLELASRIQPKNHRIWYTMGIVCDRKNMREEASAMYRKARELQQR